MMQSPELPAGPPAAQAEGRQQDAQEQQTAGAQSWLPYGSHERYECIPWNLPTRRFLLGEPAAKAVPLLGSRQADKDVELGLGLFLVSRAKQTSDQKRPRV